MARKFVPLCCLSRLVIRPVSNLGSSTNFSLAYYMGVSLSLYLSKVVFTTIDAAFGSAIGDVTVYDFEMTFPAVFLVLLKGIL